MDTLTIIGLSAAAALVLLLVLCTISPKFSRKLDDVTRRRVRRPF